MPGDWLPKAATPREKTSQERRAAAQGGEGKHATLHGNRAAVDTQKRTQAKRGGPKEWNVAAVGGGKRRTPKATRTRAPAGGRPRGEQRRRRRKGRKQAPQEAVHGKSPPAKQALGHERDGAQQTARAHSISSTWLETRMPPEKFG